MSKHKPRPLTKAQWRALRDGPSDFLVADIMSLSDDEVMAEAIEDHGSEKAARAAAERVRQRALTDAREELRILAELRARDRRRPRDAAGMICLTDEEREMERAEEDRISDAIEEEEAEQDDDWSPEVAEAMGSRRGPRWGGQ